MIDRRAIRNFDFTLLITIILIVVYGLIILSSATHATMTRGGDADIYVKKQALSFVLGLIGIGIILKIDYTRFTKYAKFIYAMNVLLLVFVKFFGEEQKGAQSWISVGSFNLQPSEFAKIAMIITFAVYLAGKEGKLNKFRDLIPTFIFFGVPMMLIILQPDLGTGLVFVGIYFGMMFVAGAKPSHLLILVLIGSLLVGGILTAQLVFGFDKPLKDYQLDRLTIFVDPYKDPKDAGYHVIQSMVSLGSGGLWGKGLYQGTQTRLNFLPEQKNDFIFSVVGEELGFVGVIALLALFYMFVFRGIRIAMKSKDMLGTLLATGIVSMIVFHLLVNIGMAAGIMPITGIPLPFFSYGGSSMLANMLGVGILLDVFLRRQVLTF
ncbi:rod shape-determining protein RodA [Phosphitispora fastidiosa]|uniref:rod shape-determining protein RodA n=1 Tax=Phosphitispora fastidiosa TaxID=2837202 RepID=UPI001E4C8803|nr:rod shape-determining protein RodA [Phosphitispora fastidiosa]MBU7008746.1 rod shape determining protein RodA [Phosphitispora fastidiosa]